MTQLPHEVRIGLAICTPMPYIQLRNGSRILDPLTVDWHRARMGLSTPTNFNQIQIQADGMEVGEARNATVKKCLSHDPVPEFLFFLDNDVLPSFDAITKLIYRARQHPEHDVYCGVYCAKGMSPPEPLIYAGDGQGPFWDWTVGDLLTTESHGITGTHMGLTLIRLSLFEDWPWDDENPWFYSANDVEVSDEGGIKTRRGTEDLWFYKQARERGRPLSIMVDTSVLAGHIDKGTGIVWGLDWNSDQVKRQKALYDKSEEYQSEKKALDIGCGATRREWKGYQTYRLDIRPDVEPDYCQDSRSMNLPDNHFDLVASSHHLEHIPRWEQEAIWKEIFRVTKPGGQIEHIVPSLDWAGGKLFDADCDEHVMNVLYGAQEAHGYERNYNLHYFGYTKSIAKELAESVGFEDVTCEDWRDNEDLNYNLIIRGQKPDKSHAGNGKPQAKKKVTERKSTKKKPARKTAKRKKKGATV